MGKRQCQRRDDPADFHDGHEAGSNGRSDLVEGPGAGDDGHGGEVDCILDRSDLKDAQGQPCSAPKALSLWVVRTYDQIANKNLHDLRRQTRPPGKHPLQYTDQEMAQRRADESAVHCHLGHSRVDVMAGWTNIFCDPRG